MQLDDGIAYRIPKGSLLALQIHFVTTGKPEKCRLTVGFRYPRVAVQKRLRFALLEDTRFAIPGRSGSLSCDGFTHAPDQTLPSASA